MMKRLIWKDLVEQRYVPLAYALLLTVMLVLWDVMGASETIHGGSGQDRIRIADAASLLWFCLIGSGLVSGAVAFSGETGSGTLSFLSSLPISSARIWWGKMLSCALTTAVSILAMLVAYEFVATCLFGTPGMISLFSGSVLRSLPDGGDWRLVGCVTGCVLSTALLASALTDRPIAAVGTAIILCIVGFFSFISAVLILNLGQMLTWLQQVLIACCPRTIGPNDIAYFLLLFPMGAALTAAYFVFRAGRSVDAITHIKVSFCAFGIWSLAFGALCGLAGCLQNIEHHAPQSSSTFGVTDGPVIREGKVQLGWTVEMNYNYTHVGIGTVYGQDCSLDSILLSTGGPSRTLDSSPELHSSIVAAGTKVDPSYLVHFVYSPAWPAGPDHQKITVMSPNGDVLAEINVAAQKSIDIFPTAQSFREQPRIL